MTNEKITVDEDQLKDLVHRLFALGQSMFDSPKQFAIVLAMASKYISDEMGIEVHSERRTDA